MVNSIIHFSVIMPFYNGDSPLYLNEALESLWNQSLRADELVIVQDGPVSSELEKVLSDWKLKMPEINHVILEQNQGLSSALNTGIRAAKHEWLARMDADDICKSDRFEKQINFIKSNPNVNLFGSWITEFTESVSELGGVRALPETSQEIAKYARWRCPFNHMTVMFKKSDLETLGMYRQNAKNTAGFGEDYELWARYIVGKYQVYNLQETLVYARTDKAFFKERRRGKKYFENEVKLLKELRAIGLINAFQFLIHYVIKFTVRMAPPFLVKRVYSSLRK